MEYQSTWCPFNFNNRFNYYNNILLGTEHTGTFYFTLFGVQLDFKCFLCRGTSWHSGSFLWRYRIKTDNSGLFAVREFKDTSCLVQQYWFIHQKVFDIQDNLPWEVKIKFNPRVGHWHLMWMASQIFLSMSMFSWSTLLISLQSILSTHNFIFSSWRVHTSTCTITSLSPPSILPGNLSPVLSASGLINSPHAGGKLRPSFCWCGRLWEGLCPVNPPKLWATLLITTPSLVLPMVAWWRL